MIQSIFFIANNKKTSYLFDENNLNKIVIDCSEIIAQKNHSFDIEINFENSIDSIRNHDYSWINVENEFVANEFCPKILKFDNHIFLQPNINAGIWQISTRNKKQLLWRFNPEFSSSITNYTDKNCKKSRKQCSQIFDFIASPTLLFFDKNPIEFSRSKNPFSAITVFTDHCDFDTSENLKVQRVFFKKNNIRTTKGFFINHFSKRNDNASYQNNSQELQLWQQDGHELCYHSLSQSIKSDLESFKDFKDFEPPLKDISVWIDHGFQSYNLSMFNRFLIQKSEYESIIESKKINTFWNYIDSGTSTLGLINQLNVSQFTLGNFANGTKKFSFKNRIILILKNIVFHFDNNPARVRNYIDSITNFKLVFKKFKITKIFDFLKNFLPLIFMLFKTILFWNFNKKKAYKLSRFQTLIFKHQIFKKTFYIFQTIEMVDFKNGLHKKNIDLLVKESGVFIAHTYFSANASHYSGKFFVSENTIDKVVAKNFEYLSQKIKSNQIWNPTLSELINYWSYFENIILDLDDNGCVFVKNNQNLISRTID